MGKRSCLDWLGREEGDLGRYQQREGNILIEWERLTRSCRGKKRRSCRIGSFRYRSGQL